MKILALDTSATVATVALLDGDKLLAEDEWLMEGKINQAMPLWMTKILSEFKIYPASFSKYGTEYKNYIEGLERLEAEAAVAKEESPSEA